MKNIAIRVDASSQIGTGHFMRCLTLADALKKRGAQVRFISRHLPDYFRISLLQKGHEFTLLEPRDNNCAHTGLAHSDWLGTSQDVDAQDSLQVLTDRIWDWLIVDHYSLDTKWEAALRQVSKKILVIDDIADREHNCDVLLDQNYYSDMNTRYAGKVPAHCHLLLGPRFALLRDEFRFLREKTKPRTGPIRRILVFFGGVDAENYTGRTIDALVSLRVKNVHIDVVIGAQHPNSESIREMCSQHSFGYHVQTDRMAELMAAADLAIGAGGSATWERCCLGLPALVLSLAENQSEIARGLDLLGAGKFAQNIITNAEISEFISNMFLEQVQIKDFSEKAYAIVDGLGVNRICEVLIG